MNRQERRRQATATKDRSIMIKESEIRQIKEQATTEAIELAFEQVLAIPIMVLRDKYGFGKKRCERFAEQMLEVWRAVQDDYISIEDLRVTLWDEAGVRLEITKESVHRSTER